MGTQERHDAPPNTILARICHPTWGEYVAYYERRLDELKEGRAAKGPLRWEAYELMQGWFARGLAFERVMVELLHADAALPKAQRRFLGDFDSPRNETYVGVWKPGSGLRFADVLVIEQQPPPLGQPPRVETFSFKSRNLAQLKEEALQAQMKADASEALSYYGETVDVRRPNLGGRWIPRQKLEEAQVLVGTRVWLPFVRAWRYMRSRQSLLDSSLTQLYHVAERHRS